MASPISSSDAKLFNILRNFGLMLRLETVHDYDRLKKFRNLLEWQKARTTSELLEKQATEQSKAAGTEPRQ